MICCLNPDCHKPENPDGTEFCQSCGVSLAPLRNRYRIIQLLGAGGFGRTFLAEDIDKLNERCVVKQFLPQAQGSWATQKATELFQQEARRLQLLGEHTQIPTLFAYFEEDKLLYLVQQFIEGDNLLQELGKQGAFSEQKIREFLIDVLPVLQFIHQQKVIHRDIKPDNIIRRRTDGKLVLIDFGIAKQLTATTISQPGTHIGTLGYAPVEQMQDGTAYPVSDLYSLGVTCFRLLTQTSPHNLFVNSGYEWAKNWQRYLPKPINDNLGYVLDKLLQKDMQQRYQSADEVWRDLHTENLPTTINQNIPQLTQPSTSFIEKPVDKPIVEKPKINHKPKALIAGLGIVFLLLVGGGYWYWQKSNNPRTLVGHSDEVNTIAVSSDGKTIASGSDDKSVKLWQLNEGKEIPTLNGHSDWIYSVAISPDGESLVSGSKDNTVKVWNLKTGQELLNIAGHKSSINSVAISPDNQNIASGSYDNTIKIWNLKTGELSRTFTGHSAPVLSVAFSHNNRILVSGSVDKNVKVWDWQTGKELRSLKGHSGDINSIALSRDGQLVASGSDDKTIKMWNVNTGRELRTFTGGHTADINAIAFSPNGKSLASGSDDKTIKLWNVMTGEQVANFQGHSAPIFAVAFTPDGKFLVSGSGDKTIKIWQVP
ncbi:protein kinase domain-containing protein [Floridanema evergladense]|uniref:Protein kinase n=1 Tax=Floridaenema evergladense BLCC-F167 TaxID=3153639 RepID=A0ABV4WKT2_9CYAN